MRTLRLLTASTLLAGVCVVVPVVSVGAAPRPVAPSLDRVAMPAGTPLVATASSRGRAAASVAPSPEPSGAESVLTRDTDDADVVGLTFPDRATATDASVEVRTRTDGAWGGWQSLGVSDAAPDPGTEEAAKARVATEPISVAGSDEVQVRVRTSEEDTRLDRISATFVDGGESPADPGVGSTPAASARAGASQPPIIGRAAWGADETLRTCTPDTVASIKGAVVHHTVNANTYTMDEVPGLLRGIYAYHVKGQGWCDVGYNFFVDRFGRLFEGRFGGTYRNVVGAQTGGFNSQTFGVSSLGNHDPASAGAATPSAAVLASVGKLVGWKAWLNGWDPTSSTTFTSAGSTRYKDGVVVTKNRVMGHRELSLTTCPGDLMFAKLASIRSTSSTTYRQGVADRAAEVAAETVRETYSRPSGTTSFSLSGRGYGHGRGMSQYGAYGAALKGLSRDQILDFYYPGTTRSTSAGNPTIRVRLGALGSGPTQVVAQPKLTITDGTKTGSLYVKNSDGTLRSRWRLVPEGSGLTLQWLQKGVWRSTSSWKATTKPLSFQDSTLGKVRVVMPDGTQRDYRRVVRSHRSGSGVMTLSVLSLNYYLQSVVPSEMPPSWAANALQAQAVAARTYALYQRAHQPSGSLYDTCDSTSCQVYKGLAGYSSTGGALKPHENSSSTAAVVATSGLAVYHGGSPALTEFSSSNGGQTVRSSIPYQVSKADPYDAVPSGSTSSWTTTLSVSRLQGAYPTTGTLRALRIESRDGLNAWGGRTTSVTVVGSKGSKTVTGDAFRTALGLRSTWWTVTSAPATSAASLPEDLDGNSRGDVIAVDPEGALRLLSGDNTGAFTARTMATGWGSLGLVASVGSWSNDNRHDVIERDKGTLYYHPGDGRGGLLSRVAISSGWDTINLVSGSGDFDADGFSDFLARTNSGQLKIYRGNGKGGVIATKLLGTTFAEYRLIFSPGDLTGDGRPDVGAVRATDHAMLLFPVLGSGTLGVPTVVEGDWSAYSAVTGPGDVTGDGRDDLVARHSADGSLVVLPGTDMGSVGTARPVSGTATWATWSTWAP